MPQKGRSLGLGPFVYRVSDKHISRSASDGHPVSKGGPPVPPAAPVLSESGSSRASACSAVQASRTAICSARRCARTRFSATQRMHLHTTRSRHRFLGAVQRPRSGRSAYFVSATPCINRPSAASRRSVRGGQIQPRSTPEQSARILSPSHLEPITNRRDVLTPLQSRRQQLVQPRRVPAQSARRPNQAARHTRRLGFCCILRSAQRGTLRVVLAIASVGVQRERGRVFSAPKVVRSMRGHRRQQRDRRPHQSWHLSQSDRPHRRLGARASNPDWLDGMVAGGADESCVRGSHRRGGRWMPEPVCATGQCDVASPWSLHRATV